MTDRDDEFRSAPGAAATMPARLALDTALVGRRRRGPTRLLVQYLANTRFGNSAGPANSWEHEGAGMDLAAVGERRRPAARR
jgi:hypothetical protein